MSNSVFVKRDENGNWGANNSVSVTVLNGTTTSEGIVMNGYMLGGLIIPATWDGGNITIQVSDSLAGTYVDAYDSQGNIVTLIVAGASRYIGITGTFLQAIASAPFIKLKSAFSVAADRVITVAVKG